MGRSLVYAILVSSLPAFAQLPGNASLQGSYHLRYLGVIGAPCDCPISFAGTAVFDGKGTYQITGQGTVNSNGSNQVINGPGSGTYQVFSSGAIRMDNPFANSGPSLFGGLGMGALIASSTDSGYLDLLVAIPAGSGSSNATLKGAYQAAGIEFANGSVSSMRGTFFPMAADGAGSLGSLTISGTSQALNNAPSSQSVSGAGYSLTSNGSGTLTIPSNSLLSGSKTLYVSPDGSLFIAGAASGYDLTLGVARNSPAGNVPISGLYFTAGLQNLANGSPGAGIFSFQGSSNETGDAAGDEVAHQRINADGYGTYDQTFSDIFRIAPGGVTSFAGSQYAAGSSGAVVIGGGSGANYQLAIYVKLLPRTASGVFLDPAGVVNAASNAPFTAQISPGEVISLYGSGLASQTATAMSLPFPTILGGVQVMIGSVPAPLYYVSPTLISAVVPYPVEAGHTPVTIQAMSNGTPSNAVQVYGDQTSPGVFTLPPGGIGNGAILHADYSVISPAHPASPGEVVQIFLTGLGLVQPAVAAGSAAPSNPLSLTVNGVAVYIGGQPAPSISFEGLAPTLGGLYQLNVEIPPDSNSGDLAIEISTVDADNVQVTIPVQR